MKLAAFFACRANYSRECSYWKEEYVSLQFFHSEFVSAVQGSQVERKA